MIEAFSSSSISSRNARTAPLSPTKTNTAPTKRPMVRCTCRKTLRATSRRRPIRDGDAAPLLGPASIVLSIIVLTSVRQRFRASIASNPTRFGRPCQLKLRRSGDAMSDVTRHQMRQANDAVGFCRRPELRPPGAECGQRRRILCDDITSSRAAARRANKPCRQSRRLPMSQRPGAMFVRSTFRLPANCALNSRACLAEVCRRLAAPPPASESEATCWSRRLV